MDLQPWKESEPFVRYIGSNMDGWRLEAKLLTLPLQDAPHQPIIAFDLKPRGDHNWLMTREPDSVTRKIRLGILRTFIADMAEAAHIDKGQVSVGITEVEDAPPVFLLVPKDKKKAKPETLERFFQEMPRHAEPSLKDIELRMHKEPSTLVCNLKDLSPGDSQVELG